MKHEVLHRKAKLLAKTYLTSEAELLGVLIEMMKERAFTLLGYKGIWEYCTQELELSESQAFYFKRVAEKSLEVPALKTAIEQGEINLSRARRIESVVTQENLGQWIEKAQTLPQKDLERAVASANPKAGRRAERVVPVSHDRSELRLGISKDFEDKLSRLKALTGKNAEEVLERAMTELLTRIDPEKKAERARKPTENQKGKQQKKSQVQRKVLSSGNRTPIPAAVRHEVVRRHGYRCVQCGTSYYLHYHHIKPVCQGGTNTADNLQLLCSAHHRIHHLRDGLPRIGSRNDFPRTDARPAFL